MSSYEVGDVLRFTANIYNSDDELDDPAAVALRVRYGDDTEVEYTYAASQITRSSVGVYYIDITIPEAGLMYYKWSATGEPAVTLEGSVFIHKSRMAP